jgi:hypothetical protein
MNELIKAIGDKYATENDFRSNLTGGLHVGLAPQDTVYPLAILDIVSIVESPIFDDTFDEALVQFRILSSDMSPSEAGTLYGYLKSLFDDCNLTIAGYTHIFMEREIGRLMHVTDEATGTNYWQYTIDYRILFKKN